LNFGKGNFGGKKITFQRAFFHSISTEFDFTKKKQPMAQTNVEVLENVFRI
jgi:hypothetical protein